ncbi:MAG: hypothetical protein KGZ58_05555, partial [Ignavibacteriales bacterium]|nr:hypothetical protein [Ignavibacteriales bacterium]
MARKFLQSVVLILSFIFIFSGKSPSQLIQNDIIINEWYLNPVSSEGKEFVEIVVLKQDADLRNIRLSDVDTKGGAGSTTEGHLTFPNSSYLTNIPLGTIIVCVLETPLPNGNLFEQDTNYADGKMVLFSGGLPGGVLIASGRMDISQNENIVLLTNDASDATTLDFIATGNNTVQSNYPDAVWSNNLSAGTGGTVTYFTNSSSNGLNNDNGQIGWQVNKLSTSKSPAARNPGQTLPSVNFPPVIVSVSRLPYIPQAGANDTVYSQITDDGGVAEALLRYRINDGGENTVTMVLTSGTFR